MASYVMKSVKSLFVLASIVLMLTVCAASNANAGIILQNGSFEDNYGDGNGATGLGGVYDCTHWTNLTPDFKREVGALLMDSNKENMDASKVTGDYLLRLSADYNSSDDRTGRIAQDLGTMVEGEQYTFTADLFGGNGGNTWSATAAFVNEATTSPSTVYASVSSGDVASGNFVEDGFNLTYTATAADDGNHLFIWLEALDPPSSPPDVRGGIDNAILTVTPVPEPATLVLLVTGLIGLLAYAWRKRK